jgi:protein TonB
MAPPDEYEELHFETEQAAQAPAPRRTQSETSVAAARMAAAPSFKAANRQGGVPIIPIAFGLILIVGIAAFALLRGQPLSKAVASPAPLDPTVVKVGRPPESPAPPVAEPEPAQPVITRDLPPDPAAPAAPAATERKRQPERDLAAAPRPVRPPPTRELAKVEKPAPATARPTPPPPAPARPEPEPPPPPPPQFVAARQELPVASAPLQIGPSYAREGQRKARLTDPGCVANSLRLPRDVADVSGETATVKFAVDEAGKVSQYAYLAGPSDQRVANAIWSAIQHCEFSPGATAQGKPVSLWVTMPIKFGK